MYKQYGGMVDVTRQKWILILKNDDDASLHDDDDDNLTTPEGMSTTKKYARRKSSLSAATTAAATKKSDGKDALAIDVLKDDDDDDLVVLTPVTNTSGASRNGARQRYERTSDETKVFDDFTMNFISNESLETSSAAVDGGTTTSQAAGGNGGVGVGRDLTNRKAREARGFERRSDRAFVNAVCKVMTVSEPDRLPQRGTYERLLQVCVRRRGGRSTRRDAENARRALEILKMCEQRAPAVRLESSCSRRGDNGRSRSRKSSSTVVVESNGEDAPPYRVVLNAKSWTPLDNADKTAAQTTTIRSPGLGRSAKEKDWVLFSDLLVRSLYGSRPEDGQGARSTRRRMTRDDAGGKEDDDDSENVNDDSYEDDSDDDLLDEDAILEEDGDRVDPAYEFVGPKLLFLHVCSALVKDARLRLRAYESWRKKGSDTNEKGGNDDETNKAAAILATNALIYRLIVDIAPSEGDRSQFFARMVEASSLAGERVALRLRDGTTSTNPSSQEYYDASSAKTTVGGKRQSSGDASYSIANAPTISGSEDCGVFEISSAARDVLEALAALLDVAETIDGASRKHSKIRVQLEDAYAEAWKATGEARLGDAEAKGAFLREIRTPTLRLARAREILARRVDRRHAPGILSGGLGDSNGAGARDVFDYIADDPVRAIKGQQHSDGSSDFALGAAALGAVAVSAAYGASSSINPALFTDSLKRCVDAYVAETDRSDVTDSTASATASLALALAFASGSSV